MFFGTLGSETLYDFYILFSNRLIIATKWVPSSTSKGEHGRFSACKRKSLWFYKIQRLGMINSYCPFCAADPWPSCSFWSWKWARDGREVCCTHPPLQRRFSALWSLCTRGRPPESWRPLGRDEDSASHGVRYGDGCAHTHTHNKKKQVHNATRQSQALLHALAPHCKKARSCNDPVMIVQWSSNGPVK